MNRLSPLDRPVRAFVALPLPAPVRAALRAVQAELRDILPSRSAAWTRVENMHLTLRFLGNVDAARIPDLQSRLHRALADFGPLDLCCERLGSFPDLRFPRVIWAWVHDSAERLPELAKRVDTAVEGSAEKRAESRFVGHVTLARPKQLKRPEARRLADFVAKAVSRTFGRWSGRELELIQSELQPSGSRYTTLDVFRL